MAIIPIFIYRDRKSDKELREEIARDRRWRELMRAEEERRELREREEKLRKEEEKRKERERVERDYREAVRKNPWDYQFLPEGWSPFGQWYIPIITEHYD